MMNKTAAENMIDFSEYTKMDATYERVTSENHWQDTRIVKVGPPDGFDTESMHTCLILPENTHEKAERFCKLFEEKDYRILPVGEKNFRPVSPTPKLLFHSNVVVRM